MGRCHFRPADFLRKDRCRVGNGRRGCACSRWLHYLWLPSPELAIRRIAQRVKKGGHFIPENDVRRRFKRSLSNFINLYAELADSWTFRDNTKQSASLLFDSGSASLPEVESFLKKK